VALGGTATVVTIDQTSHPDVQGKQNCLTVDALGTGAGVIQAGVQLSHRGGPTAAPPQFTFEWPHHRAASASVKQLSKGAHDLSGRQSARYALSAIAGDPAWSNPKQLFVHFDSPNFLSEGGDLRISIPGNIRTCTVDDLQ